MVNIKENQFRKYLIEKKGKSFLEIGCGETGFNFYKNMAGKYTGIDVSNIKNRPPTFIKQDLELNPKLPFKNKLFDAIIASDVLGHLNNRHEIMNEIKRVLKNDGIIIISLPNEFSYQPIWYHIKGINWMGGGSNHGHKYMYDLKSAREYIEKHLEIVEEKYFYLDGKLEFIRSISQWLAEKNPRWFARNIVYKCKLKKSR